MILFTNDELKMISKSLKLSDENVIELFCDDVDLLTNKENMNIDEAIELTKEYYLNMYL